MNITHKELLELELQCEGIVTEYEAGDGRMEPEIEDIIDVCLNDWTIKPTGDDQLDAEKLRRFYRSLNAEICETLIEGWE